MQTIHWISGRQAVRASRMRCDEGPMESAQKFAPWRHFLGPNTLGKDCQSSSLKQCPLVLTGKMEFIKLLLSPRWHT